MSNTNFSKGECQHCRGHIQFPSAAAGRTIACPHCSRPTVLLANLPAPPAPKPNRLWLIMVMVIVFCLGGLAGIFSLKLWEKRAVVSAPKSPMTAPSSPTPPPPAETRSEVMNHFTISGIKLEKSAGSSLIYATGKILNQTDRRRFGVRVELTLLDEDNHELGTAKDYHALMEPGAEWHFKAMVMKPKTVSVRLAAVVEDK